MKPDESVVITVYVVVMWELCNSSDHTFSIKKKSLSVGFAFSFVCGLYIFWLRSSDKTGVGCDDCTRPPSQTEH